MIPAAAKARSIFSDGPYGLKAIPDTSTVFPQPVQPLRDHFLSSRRVFPTLDSPQPKIEAVYHEAIQSIQHILQLLAA